MESLRAHTNFHLADAVIGAGTFSNKSLSIDVDASRNPRIAGNNDAFLNSTDLNLLENLLNSPLSATGIKSTVKPAETWNGSTDDFIFENHIALPDTQIMSSTHQDSFKKQTPSHKKKWGQITPCTDDSTGSPKSSECPGLGEDAMNTSALENSAFTKQAVKKFQGTGSRHSSLTSPECKTNSSSGGGGSSKTGKPSRKPTPPQDDDIKRERFLKRNRVAASKCRQKKKEYINNLEERARELTSTRNHLMAYVASLKDEIIALKTEMLKHSDCNCVAIREYLRREASLLGEMAEMKDYDEWCRALETSPERSWKRGISLGEAVLEL